MSATPPILSTKTIAGKGSFPVRLKTDSKVWSDPENNLVPDGDEKAAVLVAKPGDTTSLEFVQKFPNYREHFEPVNSNDAFPAADDAEEKEMQEATRPKRGRPPKVQTASEI